MRILLLALAVALLAGCGLQRGRDDATPTPVPEDAIPLGTTATPRPPDPSPTPIPPPIAMGRTTPPATPTPLAGRAGRLSLALDGAPWASQAGLFLARERGYFQEAGVDVHFHVADTREAALRALAAGQDDLAIVGGLDLLRARAVGAPVVSLFAVSGRPLIALIALRDGLARPRDLAGRRAVMPDDRLGRAVVEAIVRGDGLDPARLAPAERPDDPIGALVAHQIDALGGYAVREGAAVEARGAAPILFRPESFGLPEYYELVLATTDSARAGRGEALRAFLTAVGRGYADAARDPGAALDVLLRANPAAERRVVERGLADLAADWRGGSVGRQAEERWRQSQGWLVSQGLVRADLDPRLAFTNDFVATPTPTPGPGRAPPGGGPTPTPVLRPPGAPPRQTVIRVGP